MTSTARTDTRTGRAVAAVHGLAFGDALGFPASVHRTVRDSWVRSMLHQGPADLDKSRVLRPVVPFVISATNAAPMAPTDDSEAFAVAAQVFLEVGVDADAASMFAVWSRIMGADNVWTGTAQRSALLNGEAGLLPPHTGNDNPAFYDDSVLPGAIAAGIAAPTPDAARALAGRYATLTHDAVGVIAAEAVAALIARLLDDTPLAEALDSAATDLAGDDWLSTGLAKATGILDAAASPFGALPELIAHFAPRTYSHPGTVAETLPLALALVRATNGDHEQALPLAMSVARHQDSLPALVGALCGAAGSAIDVADGSAGSRAGVDVLHGVTVPSVQGVSLNELATQLAS